MSYSKHVVKLGALALALWIPSAYAIVLGPGGSGAPDPFVGQVLGPAASAVLVSPVATGTFTGTLLSQVFCDTAACASLDFLYQFHNDVTSIDSIHRITAASFAGFFTDVGTRPDISLFPFPLGTVNATTVDRSNGAGNDSTIGFNFPFPLDVKAGETTWVLEVKTDATTFNMGHGAVINSTSADVAVWAPAPEPRLAGLAAIGLLGFVALVFRRRRQAAE